MTKLEWIKKYIEWTESIVQDPKYTPAEKETAKATGYENIKKVIEGEDK